MPDRWGITLPLSGLPLREQRAVVERLPDLGYTDVWSAEADRTDAFTPLVLAAQWAPALRLGTAIVPAFTRGPALLAQSAATLANLAPGRFALGIGSSSDVIVEGWNGIPFDEPYGRVRDTLRFLRAAFTGERVAEDWASFSIRGFRLGEVPDPVPPVLVAALRPGMLRLAGREGDGAIVNWLTADDVRAVAPHVREYGKPDAEIVARIFVVPDAEPDEARALGRRLAAAYLNVPVYRAFHQWLGRTELGPMWKLWADGDRRGAVEAIPDDVVDRLVLHGPAAAVREQVEEYVKAGVSTPVLAPLGGGDPVATVEALAPQ
ncbi:LLM class F420-dependent oxidoreductase [Pseudonocardia halophobica]|uniref:LLM class F420-dependent oxidoreductase n=1 Tax=Pseudonocardia halophobica TaxID=29401 RepID=A0A9W6L238_9PSEU|nr:LLM class F420-dependent oxidoreductase [Pseudonocardia halophobica]GLL11613.1 LLM class F420-dependent oxidoreductase [Pseudonocardia halophobica]